MVINEGDLTLVERPTPVPGPLEVVIEVHGAALNAADLLQRRGLYPAPPGWPSDVPGLEMAGVISQVGADVDESRIGQRVCAIVGAGAQATHCVVPVEHLLAVPDHANWDQAGGFAEAFVTAHDALVSQGHLEPGERVLISGAAGGVGTAAVQVAHALGGRVTAVTRTSEHHDALRRLGAEQVVTIDQVGEVGPVDVLIELVGAAHLAKAQRVLAPRSRVVVIGVSGGSRVELDLLSVMQHRAHLTGSTMRSRSREEKAGVIDAARSALLPLWDRGELHVAIARTYDLTDVVDAYEFFEHEGKLGKVTLHVDQ